MKAYASVSEWGELKSDYNITYDGEGMFDFHLGFCYLSMDLESAKKIHKTLGEVLKHAKASKKLAQLK